MKGSGRVRTRLGTSAVAVLTWRGMDYLRIWADDDGVSHFEEVTLPVDVLPAEPGVAELWWSHGTPVDRVHFLTVKADAQSPDWHCGPRRQFVVFLTGWVQLTAGDGEVRRLPAGSTVGDLRRALAERFPALAGLLARSALAVDNEYADDALTLSHPAEAAVLPPVSGG